MYFLRSPHLEDSWSVYDGTCFQSANLTVSTFNSEEARKVSEPVAIFLTHDFRSESEFTELCEMWTERRHDIGTLGMKLCINRWHRVTCDEMSAGVWAESLQT